MVALTSPTPSTQTSPPRLAHDSNPACSFTILVFSSSPALAFEIIYWLSYNSERIGKNLSWLNRLLVLAQISYRGGVWQSVIFYTTLGAVLALCGQNELLNPHHPQQQRTKMTSFYVMALVAASHARWSTVDAIVEAVEGCSDKVVISPVGMGRQYLYHRCESLFWLTVAADDDNLRNDSDWIRSVFHPNIVWNNNDHQTPPLCEIWAWTSEQMSRENYFFNFLWVAQWSLTPLPHMGDI